jgi:hypothetical protein
VVASVNETTSTAKINSATGRKVHTAGNHPKINALPFEVTAACVVTEKTPTKKLLAGNKKERHAPVTPALRDDPNRYRKKTSEAHRSSPPSATPAEAIAPEVNEPSVLSPCPAARTRLTGFLTARTTPNLQDQCIEAESAKSPFFKSFTSADTSFTFGSQPPSSTAKHQDGWELFLALPPIAFTPVCDSVKPVSIFRPEQGRSIFDAIADRAKTQDTVPQNSSIPYLSLAATLPSLPHDVVRGAPLGAPGDIITTKLLAWAHTEVQRLQRLETEFVSSQVTQDVSMGFHPNMALVLYRQPLCKAAKARPTTDDTLTAWSSQRIFFVQPCGITRLVDFTQNLYDVSVEMDDGASDFDSIASPMKLGTRMIADFEASETTSSEGSLEETDLEELAEFEQYGCAFITEEAKEAHGDLTPATTLSFSDDEDVIDPCLNFSTSKDAKIEDYNACEVTMLPTHTAKQSNEDISSHMGVDRLPSTAAAHHELAVYKERQDTAHEDGEADIQYDALLELAYEEHFNSKEASVNEEVPSSEAIQLFPNLYDTEEDLLPADSDIIEAKADEVLFVTETFAKVETARPTPPSSSYKEMEALDAVCESDTVVIEHLEEAMCQEAFSSDWASQLTRLTLGTESLFTFLENLESSDHRSATKSEIVSTFIKLVNMERKELGQRPLPSSYTAATVLASKIVPHTIFLGTASLATFLAHFAFRLHDETTVDEVYRVFKAMSKEDLCVQVKATTGMMGALGMRMGKLPTFAAS